MRSQLITIDFKKLPSIIFGILFTTVILYGQDTKSLESKKDILQNQIELTNQILLKTKQNKSSTIHDYRTLRDQINNRTALIDNIRGQLDSTNHTVNKNESEIELLQQNITLLESRYRDVIRAAYRQKLTQNTWLYILSSKSLKESLLRWRYTKQFEDYCNNQIKQFQQTKLQLAQAIDTIQSVQERRMELLDQEKDHTSTLSDELEQKNILIKSLEQNEKLLLSELSKQRKKQESLNESIEKIIYGESYVSPTKSSSDNPKPSNTSSLSFSQSKGMLSWPVENGVIAKKFGRQNHPSLAGIKIENNGIDIRTQGPEDVTSIHGGVVAGRNFIPGNYNVVVVRHENYLTVYSRLGEVFVNKGDTISQGQVLGKVVNEEGIYIVHLEIWNNKQKQDPQDWLRIR